MTYLDDLLAKRRTSLERRKSARSIAQLAAAVRERGDRRDFAAPLRSAKPPAIVAEFKRASPSAGAINPAADPAAVAAAYERGGAAALSVLTEPDRFGGSFDDLRAARAATGLPVLCKDFTIEEYQVWEAAAEGADAILLIVAVLDDARLRRFLTLARELHLSALVEVHVAEEIRRAAAAGADIFGINNRDLRTFHVDTTTALRLRPLIPAGATTVAESGYRAMSEVDACGRAGIDAVLVGEALMRDGDPEGALRILRGGAA